MKKFLLGIVGFIILSSAAIVISLNSSFILHTIIEKYAPQYGIGYKEIKGNIFTGLKITEPTYHGSVLARSMILKWDPLELLTKRIAIKHLQIEELDVQAIETLLAISSSQPDGNVSKSAEKSGFGFTISLAQGSATFKPFVYGDIIFKKAGISIDHLIYEGDRVDVQSLTMDIQTDLADASLTGKIVHNRLQGKLVLMPQKKLFEHYALPLRQEAIEKLAIDFDSDIQKLHATMEVDGKALLAISNSSFNVDIKEGFVTADYWMDEMKLNLDIRCIAATPYTADIKAHSTLTYQKTLEYNGTIQTDDILTDENNLTQIADNLFIDFRGDMSGIQADLGAKNLEGKIRSDGYKSYKVHLDTPREVSLKTLVQLPDTLQEAQAKVQIDGLYHLDENASNIAKIVLRSNIVNIDANMSLESNTTLKGIATLPEDSLLVGFNEKVQWQNLFPLQMSTKIQPEILKTVITQNGLSINADYLFSKQMIEGDVKLGALTANFIASDNNASLKMKAVSLDNLLRTINHYYPIGTIPNVRGSLEAEATLTKSGNIDVILRSPQIGYENTAKKLQMVENIDLRAQINDGNITLKRYEFAYQGGRYFADKPSLVRYQDDLINLAPLWINNTLKIEGDYKLKTLQGTLVAVAKQLPVSHEYGNAALDVDLKAHMDGNYTSVEGVIWLDKSNLLYDINQKQFASDSDIIIVQQMQSDVSSPFMENLTVGVQIKSATPIIYKQGPFNIKSNVHLGLFKAMKEPLMVLGSIELEEGSSYLFRDKRFVLEKSYIYFTGRADKPLLEIKVKHQSLNHLITLMISGSPNAPTINFSSVPKLTREQILSLLLFDSEEAAGSHSGDDMMRMMGGAIAKSALSDIGIKIEHLAIGADNSIEVGKKLTDKLMIIYINGEIPVAKLKYRHSKHYESVISASQESTSYDIIFKKDFETLPIP